MNRKLQTCFVADLHLGHSNILKYCKRPFLNEKETRLLAEHKDFRVSEESVQQHDAFIIDNINAVVSQDDTLWILGDFCWGDEKIARAYRDRINCYHVNIVWGNHDRQRHIRHLFGEAVEQILLNIDGQEIFANHYAMLSWLGSYKGAWNLFGHSHGNIWKNPIFKAICDIMLNLDVGVDGPEGPEGPDGTGFMSDHKFEPWTMPDIHKYMNNKMASFKEHRKTIT